ncbi:MULTISPECIES: polysaccharide lyase 6 family protein [unclassified Pseudoalteromonas]|uniref:polysaccharide lyase 6 family protein n=1 Tax=unclassified Pseudoalteromonas TaxID=194690 RepID=UPI00110935D1|nr:MULTISPECIES: polysaccharide lyase 6 family protein [unclassified Pseudoalteromonas]TMN85632.1 alginate lyase [Pseudoalteromonas sp. S410]TMN87992.1 alginate lyase [Pseudoalteromonas sp. S408]TMN94743.1 alginate lyase [Pseudoalteromonas sp. S407]TMN99180.1 alginate lyase [Pseudoalteromonas sp. S409]TMO07028.1 alginate lyase [Pseudoalteromonas sp. S186]
MRLISTIKLSLVLIGCLSTQIAAKDYFVDNKQDFNDIAANLVAGDNVVLKDGTWLDFEILLQGQGTKNAPITLTAETHGKVILSGQSNLRLAGQYLEVSGLVFKEGYTPSSAIIEFRRNKKELAYHSRVTNVVIDNYNNPDKRESDYWVALYGQHNRFDHSHLVGKRNKGVTVAVRLNSEQSQQNYHQIDHNFFGYRPTFGSNGGETLRIGTSHYSLSDSFTVVENNYFERTNGEVEIISVKSGKNQIRNNVFFESRGTLTLRHGNGNVIEENIFFGNGADHTGGIRIINKDQVVRNNYLEGLTGYRFGSGFTVMNGVPNSPINRYHQVENATIENNTFVNVSHVQLAAGSDAERSAAPINSVMKNNLIINQNGEQPFTAFDDVSGIALTNNVANTTVLKELAYGVKKQNVALSKASNGLLYPKSSKMKAGAKRGLTVLKKDDTGVNWYPKIAQVVEFDSGKTHQVKANVTDLLNAINNAQSGDVLALADGQYDVSKLIKIRRALTIKAKNPGKAKLTYQRSTLFEIHDGGSLKLDGLVISGESAPDAIGNSVVRTQKWGMVDNYRFEIRNSQLIKLDINHSFHFFVTGKGAMADEITLTNNTFNNVTGDILRLNTEIEDLGIYNAEYVTVIGNNFNDVKGGLLKLYRGGSDESTFGPHFEMKNNTLNNVGLGKRNKEKASIYVHGVQVTEIENNAFVNSAPVVIEHTVGEPITEVSRNTFDATSAPSVKELRIAGPHTAILVDNNVINKAL